MDKAAEVVKSPAGVMGGCLLMLGGRQSTRRCDRPIPFLVVLKGADRIGHMVCWVSVPYQTLLQALFYIPNAGKTKLKLKKLEGLTRSSTLAWAEPGQAARAPVPAQCWAAGESKCVPSSFL